MVVAMFAWTSMAACSDSATAVTETTATSGVQDHKVGGSDGGTSALIECPSTTTQTAEGTITLLGGTVTLGGTQVIVPLGALLQPTKIVLTVPASRYMEVDVSVPGVAHFVFEKAIVVVVDYSRCDPSVTTNMLSAWHIDTSTKELLERMLSFDDKLNRRVIFSTGHLSGYALAN
jgi:hypothetical protein